MSRCLFAAATTCKTTSCYILSPDKHILASALLLRDKAAVCCTLVMLKSFSTMDSGIGFPRSLLKDHAQAFAVILLDLISTQAEVGWSYAWNNTR